MNAAFFTVNGYISLLFLLFWGAAVAVAQRVDFSSAGFSLCEIAVSQIQMEHRLKPVLLRP